MSLSEVKVFIYYIPGRRGVTASACATVGVGGGTAVIGVGPLAMVEVWFVAIAVAYNVNNTIDI
jgi:hypothetical protein